MICHNATLRICNHWRGTLQLATLQRAEIEASAARDGKSLTFWMAASFCDYNPNTFAGIIFSDWLKSSSAKLEDFELHRVKGAHDLPKWNAASFPPPQRQLAIGNFATNWDRSNCDRGWDTYDLLDGCSSPQGRSKQFHGTFLFKMAEIIRENMKTLKPSRAKGAHDLPEWNSASLSQRHLAIGNFAKSRDRSKCGKRREIFDFLDGSFFLWLQSKHFRRDHLFRLVKISAN